MSIVSVLTCSVQIAVKTGSSFKIVPTRDQHLLAVRRIQIYIMSEGKGSRHVCICYVTVLLSNKSRCTNEYESDFHQPVL